MVDTTDPKLKTYDLHSNMVRFIIITACVSNSIKSLFTFQYG